MAKRLLIYECAGGHGECLPSYVYYFKQLGFEISFVLDKVVANDNPLWMIKSDEIKSITIINTPAIKHELHIKEINSKLKNALNYDFYFIATLNKHTYPFIQFLLKNKVDINRILFQNHLNTQYFLDNTENNIRLLKNGFVLTHSEDFPSLPPIRNTSNLRKDHINVPFKELNILVSGLDKIHFANFEAFIKVIDKLNEENKKITLNVTGIRRRGNYTLPESPNVKYLGRVDFETMARLYVSNDFLMTFFDENSSTFKEEHHSFLKGRTSGSRNASVIYGIPLLVQKPFQSSWDLNDTNSISYENTDYEALLNHLFSFNINKYNNVIDNLNILQEKETKQCIENVKNKIEYLNNQLSIPDLVYIVKQDDHNEDLRYSLRSIAKFVNHNRIWIVGYKPSWVTNVEYLPVRQSGNKWENSILNIIAACKCDRVTDNFILMNDDFFAIKSVPNLEKSINLSLGLLEEAAKTYKVTKGSSRWKRAFKQVYDLLKSLNIPEPYYNYESHTPLLINKNKYLEIMNLPKVLQFRKTKNVLHKRTLYKNIDKKEKPIILPVDVKIKQKEDDTLKRIKVCDWLSVYDKQVGNGKFKDLNKLLRNLFSEPCKYEKSIQKHPLTKRKTEKEKFLNF